jgi:hypothetical protein
MARALSAEQLAYLAGEFSQMVSIVQGYQSACATDPTFDSAPMQRQIEGLTALSQGLSNHAMVTLFDDSDQMYRNLATITQNANKVGASLPRETSQRSRIVSIAGSMIDLAAALSSGNQWDVVSSVVSCAKAIRS